MCVGVIKYSLITLKITQDNVLHIGLWLKHFGVFKTHGVGEFHSRWS